MRIAFMLRIHITRFLSGIGTLFDAVDQQLVRTLITIKYYIRMWEQRLRSFICFCMNFQ